MHITEKMFALKRLTPFNELRHGELALIAEVTRERTLTPGEVVLAAGVPVARLYAVVQGRILAAETQPVPAVFGIVSLLAAASLCYPLRCKGSEAARDLGGDLPAGLRRTLTQRHTPPASGLPPFQEQREAALSMAHVLVRRATLTPW
jgi:hypothetical protein